MSLTTTTAFAADLSDVAANRDEQIVQTMNVPSMPVVEIRNSFLLPALSTKKHIPTAVIKLTI
jgi:hypothetical protein